MSRINSNIPSLVAQRHLTSSQESLRLSLERLSSGLKINRGADNPDGLIVSERLRSEISAVSQAMDNSSRAINVIATTEGALNEVQALLSDIQGLLVEGANFGSQAYVGVDVEIAQSAQKAQLAFSDAGVGASAVTVDIRGNDGIITLTFPASATTIEMVNAINRQVDSTGVTAVASGTDGALGMRL